MPWVYSGAVFNPKKGKFKTWIFSIAKNTSIDWLRKKKTIPFSNFENEEGENTLIRTLADPTPLPNKVFEKATAAKLLNSAIKKLPYQYRTILLMHHDDQFTYREIAEALNEPLNTIKSRYRRALILLKKLLTDNYSWIKE